MPRIGLGAGLLATVLLAAGPLRGQNLLVNPGFDGGLDGWTPDAGASVVYGSRDATSSQFSGSALVTNSAAAANVPLGLSQCVAVIAGAAYTISTRFLIPSGQAASATARVSAQFFAGPTCGAGTLGSFGNGTAKITTFDAWSSIATGFSAASAGAQSARVSVWVQKIEGGGSVQGSFDLVAFGPKAVLTILASASIHGQNETFFHTDLWLFNGSPVRPLFVLLKHFCFPGQACSGAGPSVMIPPRASQLLGDVLAATFHDVETADAYVVVTSSVPVFSYATVIDNQSGDPIFVSGEDDAP
ncbi:MAG TPA: hypothetical protein VKF32_06045 [Thermoanaerobaculia bacterium]|nr:hypothetical protein [Thermoanaerobaculia bacterium]